MPEVEQELALALTFARRALKLLDRSGELGPAIHLQRAIDVMIGMPVPRTEAEVDAVLAGREALDIQRQFGWLDQDTSCGR